VERRLRLVEELHELPDPALVAERPLAVLALVVEADRDPGVEEGEFAQPRLQRREDEVRRLEDVVVRPEPDRRPGRLPRLHLPEAL